LIDPAQTHTHELFGFGLNVLETDNLPVIFAAVPSREAANHHHHRFARSAGKLSAFVIVGEPAIFDAGLDAAPLSLTFWHGPIGGEANAETNADEAHKSSQEKPETTSELKVCHGQAPKNVRIKKDNDQASISGRTVGIKII
jgi:hypothetical protein